ncbi:hypothetical protein MMC12_005539 [Toensbergia leucococca]|nr:hypothetical protein [Toensbergia leucococca]
MKRIRNQSYELRKKALAALSLVHYAKGQLTFESIQQALAVRDGDERFDEDGIDTEETLINITAGLLTMRSGHIAFAHHTVEEFLGKSEGEHDGHETAGEEIPRDWFTDKNLGHGYVANQCLDFLVLKDFDKPLVLAQRKSRAQTFPFLEYAVNNVGHHATRCTPSEDKIYGLTRRCLALLKEGAMPLGTLQEFVARMWTNPHPNRVRILQLPGPHLAVLCNFVYIARTLVTAENVNQVATTGNETVLNIAARIKSKEMVEILLEKQGDRDLVNYSGKTPLDMILAAPLLRHTDTTIAIPNGSADGADISHTCVVLLTLMRYIECRGGLKLMFGNEEQSMLVELLTDTLASYEATNEVATIIKDKIKLTISKEGEELAALFIGASVGLNSDQTSREAPLQLATLYELPNLVKLLLEKGANPFLVWHCTFTPAEIAERRENNELIKILRDKEKEIDAWEASISDESEKQDIPGRVQAAHFIRKSRKLILERQERMHAPLFSIIDEAFARMAEKRETCASKQSSNSSNERELLSNVQLTQQQSSGEAAKASKVSDSDPPGNHLTHTATVMDTLNGEMLLGSDSDSDSGDPANVHAHTKNHAPESIDAAMSGIATACDNSNNHENRFNEQVKNVGVDESNGSHNDIHYD